MSYSILHFFCIFFMVIDWVNLLCCVNLLNCMKSTLNTFRHILKFLEFIFCLFFGFQRFLEMTLFK